MKKKREAKKIGEDETNSGVGGNKGAGNNEGEDVYETEITLDELLDYITEDLNLPNLDRKSIQKY